jgi:hypothetical protein
MGVFIPQFFQIHHNLFGNMPAVTSQKAGNPVILLAGPVLERDAKKRVQYHHTSLPIGQVASRAKAFGET